METVAICFHSLYLRPQSPTNRLCRLCFVTSGTDANFLFARHRAKFCTSACICKAKQQRQVIIVTHNPNLAVACDAEQIVFCEMNKDTYQVSYTSGAIENPEIRKHVIDVLEGTMPAFDLRRRKYI